MEALLVVFLLCCVPPGVRASLPVVESVAAPEARSAAALLTSFMKPQRATLAVLGDSRWSGTFIRELSTDIPRVLIPMLNLSLSLASEQEEKYSNTQFDRLYHALMVTHWALFVPTDGLEQLLFAIRNLAQHKGSMVARILFWTTESMFANRDKVLRRFSETKLWLGGCQYALALTSTNGSTTLYHLTCTSDDACRSRQMTILETDEWSPVDQRWRLGADVFHQFCNGYRPIGKHQDLTMFVQTIKGSTNKSSLLELTKVVVDSVSRGRHRRLGSNTPVKYQETWRYRGVHVAMMECNLAAVLTDESFFGLRGLKEMGYIPDRQMAVAAVIVPAGYGSRVSIVESVTVEFSSALWLATGLATLCTVVVLKCTRRQDVSGAVLQALAPMLGQATPPPAPPRPQLAAWLLACVVLTAAYQGLLLGRLSSAVPRHELESLRDLEDSGLPVKMSAYLAYSHLLTDKLTARTEYVLFPQIKTIIDTIANARNCALVTFFNRHTNGYMRPYMTPPNPKLHAMKLSYSHLNIIALTTKGSPLERPIARVQARAEAAGLLARWRRAEYEREDRDDAKRLVSLQGPRPLTLAQLKPAFVVLGVAHAVAVVVFALEALCAWRACCTARKMVRGGCIGRDIAQKVRPIFTD
ncbi:Ionotropic receptor 180 [Frankliniella occidentalis]|nr:Ionotropic receptor 180 [Frankliniella occidentalis]